MEEGYRIDLTYITKRIIAVSFPRVCPEETYLQNLRDFTLMLKSKHGHNYMVINLSEKNQYLTQMNSKILDTGWLNLLAPSLDQMCSVCSAMESWLHTDPQHVLVLHSRGGRDRIGVLVGSYIHFTNTSASAELGLDHFTMRRFYTDQLSSLITPSQKRYVQLLSSLLRGVMKMSSSPLFLLCVVLHGVSSLSPEGGCSLFLRVYQSLQAVCTSAVYHVQGSQTDRVYFVLQPAQLLNGDIMVVCYDKNTPTASRQVVFRLQFHTGIVHGHAHTLVLPKEDLDGACGDPRFPDHAKVELVFSESPEKRPGSHLWQNERSVLVDYDTLDPLVRRDSYHDVSPRGPAHTQGPVDGSLYARVRKTSAEEGASSAYSDPFLSASSDSGFSVASQWTGAVITASPVRGPVLGERTQPWRPAPPPLEGMTELTSNGGERGEMVGDEAGAVNGEASSSERETDILDDDEVSPAQERRASAGAGSLSFDGLPGAQGLVQSGYSTHTWVQQQQIVDAHPHTYPSPEGRERAQGARGSPVRTTPPPGPETPPRGSSSRAAVQRGAGEESPDQTDGGARNDTLAARATHPGKTAHTPPPLSEEQCREEELASLATDIDDSIEQLNQLILDLDPTFVPVPTRSNLHGRSSSRYTNGVGHGGHGGHGHQSVSSPAGWQQRQASDVRDFPGLSSQGWGGALTFSDSSVCSPSPAPSQVPRRLDSVDYESRVQTPASDSCEMVPPTPAFPISPPTPYVKSFSEFLQLKPRGLWEQHRTSQDSRSFLDSISHSAGPVDGELFCSEASVTPASCQRSFHGSIHSASSGSPLPHADCPSPSPVWQDRTPNASFHHPHHPHTPLTLSGPNAHSSPRGAPRGLGTPSGRDEGDSLSSLLLGNGVLEHSLLEAVEGLGSLGLDLGDGGLPPLLPEKRRGGEGAELLAPGGSRSPSLSGFSSPHSGSSMSIPFPSAISPDPLRGLGGAPSPGAELFASKHDTAKFVQDTSKFWYKPDISRDQAITVLKDKEPGAFIVRDSHSFRGAYGLAMKVATPPPTVLQQSKKVGDLSNELVRHFLIECTQKGVRLKGCPNEPYFGSLTALVCQHSITPLALPCKLIIPDGDPMEELSDSSPQSATNSAAELLKQGAACNVWFLGSVELESLTGYQAVQKATSLTLAMEPPPTSTIVHFKVSAQGITLTDNQRKLFFRRHYTVNTVIFCSLDPQDRKWTRDGSSSAKVFGFVARKSGSGTENVCHLFAEHDPEQPASAIVNFVSKVMIGSQKNK